MYLRSTSRQKHANGYCPLNTRQTKLRLLFKSMPYGHRSYVSRVATIRFHVLNLCNSQPPYVPRIVLSRPLGEEDSVLMLVEKAGGDPAPQVIETTWACCKGGY